MKLYIETERLIIRKLQPSDDAGMFAMDNDPEVHRYLGNKPIKTIEESRDVIAFVNRQYEEYGIGRWAIVEKDTNEFVGWTGFKYFTETVNGHSGHYDFGYRLMRKFWGKGYATESGMAALHYGINELNLKNIYGMTDVDNQGSRHVLEKLGFKLVEVFAYDAEPNWRDAGAPTTWYKLPDN